MEIELLPPSADRAVVERVAALVNHVYAESEKGLWRGSADRTSAEEVAGFVAAGEIGVAFVDGDLAGAVRIQRLDAVTGEFGMLAADPARRGWGSDGSSCGSPRRPAGRRGAGRCSSSC